MAVTTRSQENLVTAKISAPPCSTWIEVQYEHVQAVVPMQQVNKAATTISEVKRPMLSQLMFARMSWKRLNH
jgi:hypothetical protein